MPTALGVGVSLSMGAFPGARGSIAAAVLADSPVAYWRLGEASGTTAADASGNNHPGTLVGGVTLGLPGALPGDPNTAMGFDGSTGVITAVFIAMPGPISLETWVYFAANGDVAGNPIIVSQDSEGQYLRVLASRVPRFVLKIATVQRTVDGVAALSAAAWHHLVGTWQSGDVLRLYADGVEVVNSVTPYTGVLTSFGSLVNIGRFQAPSNYLLGRLDEVALYNAVLSPARVLAHYKAGV